MKIRGSSQTNEERTKLYSELHALLDAISDNLNLISPDLRIVWTNAATARQLKKSPSEILGKYCYNLWHNRQEPCEICPVQRTLKTGNQESDTVTTPDGRIWDLRAFPIKDESGQIVNVIEVGRDITDQKKLAEQLRHAQKMEAIGTFAGGIAHDFNNMLNIIIGYGGLIQIKMKPDDPMMPLLNKILSAADKAAQLTRNLLCFSRKQATEVIQEK
jgi:sensor histidine kinase regulating citrate/malate metabolism